MCASFLRYYVLQTFTQVKNLHFFYQSKLTTRVYFVLLLPILSFSGKTDLGQCRFYRLKFVRSVFCTTFISIQLKLFITYKLRKFSLPVVNSRSTGSSDVPTLTYKQKYSETAIRIYQPLCTRRLGR